MKNEVLYAEGRWCRGFGTGELEWGALRKILKYSKTWVSRVLLRLPFLKPHQAPVEFEVRHVSTHSMISAFSLGSMTFSHRSRSRSA